MPAVDPGVQQGTLLLDIDDTLCLNDPFGCLHARLALMRPWELPSDIWDRLFSLEAVEVLNELMAERKPRVVITSSWLALFERAHFVEVFKRVGLPAVGASLHEAWAAPQNRGTSRLDSISAWMKQHHCGEPFLLLDDFQSGESLVGSDWEKAGNVVLCAVGDGFRRNHLPAALRALGRQSGHG